jgi:hypothetical protein
MAPTDQSLDVFKVLDALLAKSQHVLEANVLGF